MILSTLILIFFFILQFFPHMQHRTRPKIYSWRNFSGQNTRKQNLMKFKAQLSNFRKSFVIKNSINSTTVRLLSIRLKEEVTSQIWICVYTHKCLRRCSIFRTVLSDEILPCWTRNWIKSFCIRVTNWLCKVHPWTSVRAEIWNDDGNVNVNIFGD